MGNSSSSGGRGHHDETVDFGHLTPQGVYSGPRDYNQAIVSQLIVARRLAPFYRPLEDYNEDWDDDQILAARKELPTNDVDETNGEASPTPSRAETYQSSKSSISSKRSMERREPTSKPEATVYRGAVECPICFLYYPPNINHSRCCDQAICTECFVQIKRLDPTTTHIVSEPAACPYCVQDKFGVVYKPPIWRAGMGSEHHSHHHDPSKSIESSAPAPAHRRRQKSFSHDSPEVVSTDQIRPDWEAKLAAVRAAVARRANRRIIMRQVGDRLIPVGVTSGRVHALLEDGQLAEADSSGSSRRSRRRNQLQPQGQEYGQYVTMGGQDLEELMLMEAMRLSLIDHEEQQRKEAKEKAEKEAKERATQAAAPAQSSTSEPLPGPSRSSIQENFESTPIASSFPQHVSTPKPPSQTHLVVPSVGTPTLETHSGNITPHPIQTPTTVQTASDAPSFSRAAPSGHTPQPLVPIRTDTDMSVVTVDSLDEGADAYNTLASSPDSTISHIHLLQDEEDQEEEENDE